MAKTRKRKSIKRKRASKRAKPRSIKRKQSRPIKRKQSRKTKRKRRAPRGLSRAQMRKRIQSQAEIIKELVRRDRRPRDVLPPEDDGDDGDTPFVIPKGAKIIQRGDDGEPTGFEMPSFLDDYDDFDSGAWEYDDEYAEELDHEEET